MVLPSNFLSRSGPLSSRALTASSHPAFAAWYTAYWPFPSAAFRSSVRCCSLLVEAGAEGTLPSVEAPPDPFRVVEAAVAADGSLSSSSRHFSFFPGSSAQQMCSAVLLNLPLLALGFALFPPGYLNSSLCSALQSPLSQARWIPTNGMRCTKFW